MVRADRRHRVAADRSDRLLILEQQRLGIARALVDDPAVVFLDEPTLGLDPSGRRQVLDLLRAGTVALSRRR